MAKKAYIGVDGKARKIKKGYVGVDGKARKIKKAYIGIGGVARPCWSGGEIAYYGKITPLSSGTLGASAASVGNYALFAGYSLESGYSALTDAFDKSLTRTNPTGLSVARGECGAASIGNYAIFAGGSKSTSPFAVSTVDAYDTSLTRTNPTALYNYGYPEGTTTPTYAMFWGYYNLGGVNAYNASLTRKMIQYGKSNTEQVEGTCSAASVGNYAIYPGRNSDRIACAYAVSDSLTVTSIANIGAKIYHAGASTDKYAIFAGGCTYPSDAQTVATVHAYNESLTLTQITSLSSATRQLFGGKLGECAVFSGGIYSGFRSNTYAFDGSLTMSVKSNLSVGRCDAGVASVGDFLLIGGGQSANTTYDDIVEAYTIA